MPRMARVIVPNTPHHIVQRGHCRKPVFFNEGEFRYYLSNLRQWKQALGLKLYSYCLMSNHIHLIVEPADDPSAVSELMKRLAAKQTRLVNRRHGRSGSLWEGRFKSSPIDRDCYLLQCCRYVELNPVKARIVEDPLGYTWSSYAAKIGKLRDRWLDEDPAYLGLSPVESRRQVRYKNFVLRSDDSATQLIQEAVDRNQLTGSARFIDEVEGRMGLRVETRGRGRPRHR